MTGTLRRFTTPVDGTIPVPALLYNDEQLLATNQDGVGIYDGEQKAPKHQSGTIFISTHRLFYIDNENPFRYSFTLDLAVVSRTEYYSGLFKSSSKVTLHLVPTSSVSGTVPPTSVTDSSLEQSNFQSWECQVCAYRNPPGLSPNAAQVCGLCGVPRTAITAPPAPSASISASLPSTSLLVADGSSPVFLRPSSTACPACTFLNHPSMRFCEICSTELPAQRSTKSAPSSRPASPEPFEEDGDDVNSWNMFIRLSFRKGGDKSIYSILKRSLQQKAWEAGNKITPPVNALSVSQKQGLSGISGILLTVESSAQNREMIMTDALKDLEAFMAKAKDMVRLAAELNERLTAASSASTANALGSAALVTPVEPEEATFIRSSLSQLGLEMANTPVTLDMIKDERKWIDELARELAAILQGHGTSSRSASSGGMMKERGIIALDEVWGGWNRARGVALIPPSTFLQVIPRLPLYTDPVIDSRNLGSGLSVLHTPPYSHNTFSARVVGYIDQFTARTTTEIAHLENITVGLASEMVSAVEDDGVICRDDSSSKINESGGYSEVKWWKNVYTEYIWDGQR